jgi:hypothetical protein
MIVVFLVLSHSLVLLRCFNGLIHTNLSVIATLCG